MNKKDKRANLTRPKGNNTQWWEYCYTITELRHSLQDLNKTKGSNLVRYSLACCIFSIVVAEIYLYSWPVLAYMTNWAAILVVVYLLVSIHAQKRDASAGLLAAHHILFTLSFLCNIIVMSVYWSLLHSVNMAKPEYQYPLP